MKIKFNKKVLEDAVTDALCAVSDKNTIPAIEGIRFKTEKNGNCSLTSYDLEKGFRTEIPCDCTEGGNYIINAQKLSRIIRMMPDDFIDISINDKNVAVIYSGKSKFELHSIDGSTFPTLPELAGDRGFSVTAGNLRKMINQTLFAVATSDQRPMLCGALFKITDGNLKIVACDGNRLAIREKVCEIINKNADGADLDLSFIVPGRTLSQLMKLMSDEEEVIEIYLGRKHVIFKLENKTFFSRLIDTDYIDFDRVIPKAPKTHVVCRRSVLIGALERASLVTEDKALGQSKSCVRCEFVDGVLKISSVSVSGSVYDEVLTDKEGDDIVIGFNCRYLLDALRASDGEDIKIDLSNPLVSIIITATKNTEGENYLYMVCPVKMKE